MQSNVRGIIPPIHTKATGTALLPPDCMQQAASVSPSNSPTPYLLRSTPCRSCPLPERGHGDLSADHDDGWQNHLALGEGYRWACSQQNESSGNPACLPKHRCCKQSYHGSFLDLFIHVERHTWMRYSNKYIRYMIICWNAHLGIVIQTNVILTCNTLLKART
jgi:hypothetical protein